MRSTGVIRAGTYAYEAEDLVTGWHTHDLHQIEYAFQGVVEVETRSAHYFLPPQKAVWIPAGLPHQTTLRQVRTMSVFFDPALVSPADDRPRVLAVAPIFREMIVYAARWPIDRTSNDALADSYFTTLAQLIFEWLDYETPFSVPTSTDPLIAAVMSHTNNHLEHLPIHDLCRAVGVSERTLRRRFLADTGMTWRQYLLQTRLLSAMALLTERDRSVLDVATTVGFESASAFTRAFTRYAGETPSAYRQRALTSAAGAANGQRASEERGMAG
ncbi:MAG: AraC family transcriptional regulator [Frankiales bacterium]|nr:AraC family transcriptional regulator [Frankiales bacterium]